MARLLLIEPDYILARVYGTALTNHGYDVVTVHDAQTAIKSLDVKVCDLIILELQLVEHNGIEFIYELRSYAEWQKIPILIHTMVPPTSMHLQKTFYSEYNIMGYLYKPSTSVRKLTQTIDDIILVKA